MTSARSRRSSLAHQSLSASLRTTDTILTTTTLPGLLTKTSWFVTVFQTIRLSTFKSNRQATTNLSALWQTSEKLHTSKVKHTQTEQSERRENRYQTHNNESRNEY